MQLDSLPLLFQYMLNMCGLSLWVDAVRACTQNSSCSAAASIVPQEMKRSFNFKGCLLEKKYCGRVDSCFRHVLFTVNDKMNKEKRSIFFLQHVCAVLLVSLPFPFASAAKH